MAKVIKIYGLLLLLVMAMTPLASHAGVFDQKESQTAKWSRLYMMYGRATGGYGADPVSLNLNSIGFKNMRGQFGYGAEYLVLYRDGSKIETTNAVMSIRPDWNLEAEPSLLLSYGMATLSGSEPSREGKGTVSSIGLSLDLLKGPFYSTSLGLQNIYLNSDAMAVRQTMFQSVTFSLNLDFY
jgi:hypothetical protein